MIPFNRQLAGPVVIVSVGAVALAARFEDIVRDAACEFAENTRPDIGA